MDEMDSPFRHVRLRVYGLARDWLRAAQALRTGLPRGLAPVGDQLTRAALSVQLNLAEAVARDGGHARQLLTVALGSAAECSAVLDALLDVGLLGEAEHGRGQSALADIGRMLRGLRRRYGGP